MRTYKIVLAVTLLALAAVAAYGAFMYVYTENMFSPVPLLTAPQTEAPHTPGLPGYMRFIHRVNTPARARAKDKQFNGFEVDVWQEGGNWLAAHDAQEARAQVPLASIFETVQKPGEKWWWLDLKQELGADQLNQLLALAGAYHIPPAHLLFEAPAGPTAELIQKHNLHLLLQLPDGFEEDRQDPSRRARLNQEALSLWQTYRPAAVSASFGKYGVLRAYFPHMPKAIYYAATVRPSLKKRLMANQLQKDPSVQIFMTDEYTYFPF